MFKSFAIFASAFSLAFLILIISVFRLASIDYAFSQPPSPTPDTSQKEIQINYNIPYPGRIKPDSFLWPLKATRDRIWVALTTSPSKRADLYLLMADKRLGDAEYLFKKNNPDLAVSVLTKAEKYLESANNQNNIAEEEGMDTKEFLNKFLLATLKHRHVQDQMLSIAPEDAKPLIVRTQDYSKNLYQETRNGLLELGSEVPKSPFE